VRREILLVTDKPQDDGARWWEWPDPRGDGSTHYSVHVSGDGLQYGGFVETESAERHAVGWKQTFEDFEARGPEGHVPDAVAQEVKEYVRRLRTRSPHGAEPTAEAQPRVEVTPLCERLRHEAQRQGEIPVGSFRVSVLEPNLRISHHDFASREEACAYANDAASETEDNPPIAYVFDDALALVHRGRPYWAST
jgi:hypothetical protein